MGGEGDPDFYMRLDFEIAVDQQTRAHDRTFEGVPISGCQPEPAGHIWANCAKSPQYAQNSALGLLVATSLLETYIQFHENCIKIG